MRDSRALVSAFRRRDEGWTRTELWRLRTIARLSFTLVFLAVLPFPFFALASHEVLVIRILSASVVLLYLGEIVAPGFDRRNWPGRSWVESALVDAAFALVSVASRFLAQTGLLELALILRLIHPVNLFLRVLRSLEPRVVDG